MQLSKLSVVEMQRVLSNLEEMQKCIPGAIAVLRRRIQKTQGGTVRKGRYPYPDNPKNGLE